MDNKRRLTVVPDLDSTQHTTPSENDTETFEDEDNYSGLWLLVTVHYADPQAAACLDVMIHRPWEVIPEPDGSIRDVECDILLSDLANPDRKQAQALERLLERDLEWKPNPLHQIPGLFATYIYWWPGDISPHVQVELVCTVPQLQRSIAQVQEQIDVASQTLQQAIKRRQQILFSTLQDLLDERNPE